MAKSADAFRTISEVADWLGVQTHVLRFWESKFTQVKPVKRAGGRRYYRPVDMQLLGGIQKLLHDDGLTIKGVQKILREKGIAHVSALSPIVDGMEAAPEVIKPAPMVFAEPKTGEVVPLIFEPTEEDNIKRPSFTQDAVVMPGTEPETQPSTSTDTPAEETEGLEATPTDHTPAADLTPEPAVDEPVAEDDVSAVAPATEETYPSDLETAASQAETDAELAPTQAEAESKPTDAAEIDDDVDRSEVAEPAPVEIKADDEPEPAADPVPAETPEAEAEAEISDPIAETQEPLDAVTPEIEPEDDATPEQQNDLTEPQSDPIPVLPSFLSRSTLTAAPATDNPPPSPEPVSSLPETIEPKDVEPTKVEAIETPTEPAKPKPNNIDVPDTPLEAEIAASPRALSALSQIKSLTPKQATAIAPLVEHLREVRDRMMQGRKE